jgi:Flavin containing amine oxidoreductase
MYGGVFASKIEDWTDTEIVQDCMGVLKRATHRDIPDPVDYCVTRWGKEQYSRMAFTYIPPGVDGPKELDFMSQAIYDPVQPGRPLIMFAGEHTTPYHPSTMHGAFLSGIREAYRYDLYMEPAMNGYMEFQGSEHIYQHTFQMKRVYRNTKHPTIVKRKDDSSDSSKRIKSVGSRETTPNISQEQLSRRQGFGGMTLRKRPKTITSLTPTRVATKNSTKERVVSGTRRSQRSLTSMLASASSPDIRSVPQIR